MRTLRLLLMLLALAVPLAACGGGDSEPSPAESDAPVAEEAPAEPTDVPATEAPTEEPTEEPAEAGTRDNPVPLGQPADVGDWTVTVLEVNPDAAEIVAAENQFNDAPAEGHQLVMVRVSATYNGDDSAAFWVSTSTSIVGNAGNAFSEGCGVIPDDMDNAGEMFAGATSEGNLCYSVESVQLDGATLSVDESFSLDDTRKFFALQ